MKLLSTTNRMFRTGVVTDGATVTPDPTTLDIGLWTIAGNRTVAAPTLTSSGNPPVVDGQQLLLRITQDATGTRIPTWNAIYRFPNGVTPTLSTTPSKTDILLFQYNLADAKWDCLATQIFDAPNLALPVGAAVRRTTNLAVVAAGTIQAVALDTVDIDTNTFWTVGSPTQIKPNIAGLYSVVGSVFWFNEATTTYRKVILRKNGTTTIPGTQALGLHDASALMSQQAPVALVQMNGTTDYIELMIDAGTTGTQIFGSSTDGAMLIMWRLR